LLYLEIEIPGNDDSFTRVLHMRRQRFTCGIFLSLLLLLSACGKKEAALLEDQNPIGAPPAPIVYSPTPTPTPTSVLPAPTSAPNYLPTGITEGPYVDFNRFNRTLGQCEDSLNGDKGGLMGFLLRLLQGGSGYSSESVDYDATAFLGPEFFFGVRGNSPYYQYPQTPPEMPNYAYDPALYEQNGFEPSEQSGECMGRLRNRMGKIRRWMPGGGGGKFKARVQNWLAHSTDWATSGVEYPESWPSQQMPQGPMYGYQQGQTFFPPMQQWKGRLRAGEWGGNNGSSYYHPTN